MARRNRLSRLLLFLVLELGALAGVPMKPDEIEELTNTMNRPAIAQVRCESEGDDDPPE